MTGILYALLTLVFLAAGFTSFQTVDPQRTKAAGAASQAAPVAQRDTIRIALAAEQTLSAKARAPDHPDSLDAPRALLLADPRWETSSARWANASVPVTSAAAFQPRGPPSFST